MYKIISKNKLIFVIAVIAIAGFSVFYAAAGIFKTNTQVVNDLKSGLVGYWTFDGQDTNWGANTTNDKSGNENNGRMISMSTSTTPVAGMIGQAIKFNGSNYVDISGTELYKNNLNLTFSAWVKGSNSFGVIYAEDQSNDGQDNRFWIYNSGDNKVRYYSRINWVDNTVVSNGAAFSNQWNHLVITDNNGSVKIYINGALDKPGSYVRSGSNSLLNRTAVGCKLGSSGALHFNGDIDEIRTYNRALTASEVTELYNQGAKRFTKINSPQTDKLTNGLVGYWTMDGQDTNWGANTVLDRSGNNNTGTMFNMSTSTSPTAGLIGQALNFNGSNYIEKISATGLPQGNNPFTISAFLNPSLVNSYRYAVSWGTRANSQWNTFGISQGRISVDFFGLTTIMGNTTLKTNTWYHAVASYNGTTMKIFLNGAEDQSISPSGVPAVNGSNLVIGMDNTYDWSYFGKIDEVRIYNRALSQSEVVELYNQGAKNLLKVNMPQTDLIPGGLVGYWTFNGQDTNWATGMTNDRSGQGYNGQLLGMSTSTSPVAGISGQAMNFNGSNSIVSVNGPSSPNLNLTSAVSGSVWIKPEIRNSNTAQGIFIGGGGLTSYKLIFEDYSWSFCGTYGPVVRFGNSGWICSAQDTLTHNQWNHVAFTANTTSINIYVNGSLIASNTGSYTVSPSTSDYIIGLYGVNFFDGLIDEMRIYNRILSASEIKELYKAGAGIN